MSQSKAEKQDNSASEGQTELPRGWTQHTGPQGQIYYYNSISKQSTYTRPTSPATNSTDKPDKPVSKIPIPGADGWLKVTTTLGNVFYTHKPSKRSEWTIPEEIKDQVIELNRQLREKAKDENEESKGDENDDESSSKRKRSDGQVEGEKSEKIDPTRRESAPSHDSTTPSKRQKLEQEKEDEQQPITEFVSNRPSTSDQRGQEGDDQEEKEDPENQDEDEDEEWQRQMAAEMAAEAQEQEEREKAEGGERESESRDEEEMKNPDGNPSTLPPPGPPPSKPTPHPNSAASDQPFLPSTSIPNQPIYSGPPPAIDYSIPPPNPSYSVPPPQMPPQIPFQPPAQPTNFSHEESLALFKRMLTSLNGTSEEIDPMAPWDRELPKFVHRIEYSRLNSLKDRQEAFNDWCKIRLREKRAEKLKSKADPKGTDSHLSNSTDSSQAGKSSGGKKEKSQPGNQTSNPNSNANSDEKAYKELLRETVTSTRTIWEDFKKSNKKDRRFFAFGRDDKVREKAFRDWLRDLGEIKRQALVQSEKNFKSLLSEKLISTSQCTAQEKVQTKEEISELWKKLKQTKGLSEDERYEKVGSSSRRSELFAEWFKREGRKGKEAGEKDDSSNSNSNPDSNFKSSASSKSGPNLSNPKADQRAQALREREEKVQREKSQLDRKNHQALNQIQKQDSVLNFNQFLIDEIRDPLLTFDEISKTFQSDPRFKNRDLNWGLKKDLAEKHLDKLFERKRNSLRKIFQNLTGADLDLDGKEDEILENVKQDAEFERLRLHSLFSGDKLGKEFAIWKEEKFQNARLEFEEMLKENAFISFWGKLRKENQADKAGEGEGEEGSGGGGGAEEAKLQDEEEEDQPDLLKMAQKVDLEEVHSVLRNDQRYRAFKHLPEKRDEWIRDHLSNQAKLKQTVHQK